MSVFKNGRFYHFEFKVDGRRRRGSTGTANKQQAIVEERRQRSGWKKLQPDHRGRSSRAAAENDQARSR